VGKSSSSRREAAAPSAPQRRRPRLPQRWRAELGDVDEDTVLIMASLARLSRKVGEAYRADLRSFGLTWSEYTVLHTLRIEGSPYRLSPSRLNDVLALSSGGVTKTVDRLEAAGLVRRTPDPSDGRGVQVALTRRGRSLAARIFDAGLSKYSETLDPLGAVGRRRVVEALYAVLDALDAVGPDR